MGRIGVDAKLLNIYFCGDKVKNLAGRPHEKEWGGLRAAPARAGAALYRSNVFTDCL